MNSQTTIHRVEVGRAAATVWNGAKNQALKCRSTLRVGWHYIYLYNLTLQCFKHTSDPLRERKSVVRPVEKTRIIEQHHQTCFSKSPVKVCPRNTHPIKMESEKEHVVFSCMPRNSIKVFLLYHDAKHYLSIIFIAFQGREPSASCS